MGTHGHTEDTVQRRTPAVVLIVMGIALAAVGLLMEVTSDGRPDTTGRTVVLAAIGAVLVVCGTIVYAGDRR
jgi:uncharacterized membrane protein YidH (DUF202 family)